MKTLEYIAAVRAKIANPDSFCFWNAWGEDAEGNQYCPGHRPAKTYGLLGAMAEVMRATGSEYAAELVLETLEHAAESKGFPRIEAWLEHPATDHEDVMAALEAVRCTQH